MISYGIIRHYKTLGGILVFTMMVSVLFVVQPNNYPQVSTMKLFIFTYGSSSMILGFASLNNNDTNRIIIWLFSLLTSIVLLSLPTFAFPAIAYARNGTGFQGIMSHPQTFGPMLTPIVSWIISGIFISKNGKIIKSLIISFILLTLMILSEARTGIVAVALSISTTFIIVIIKSKYFLHFRMDRFIVISILTALVVSVCIVSSPDLRSRLTGFVFKHQSKNIEQALSSRSGGVESQWNFFLDKPLFGHGFGVPAGGEAFKIVKVMGVPISAPIEKGFLPTAVLEEVGLMGSVALLYFILSMAARISKSGDPRWLAVFFACIFVNVGEMVFFSLGGIGLYFWLWIGLSTKAGNKINDKKINSPATGVAEPTVWGRIPVRLTS